MRRLDITNDVMRFLKKLDRKQFSQILNALSELCLDPRPADSIAMGDKDQHFRKDAGEFRIVYRFDDKNLSVSVIGKRNDDEVYKSFTRK
jgi:mRNA interferase RelE/StbE